MTSNIQIHVNSYDYILENNVANISHTLNPGSFPRIEVAFGNVSERFHFHCQLAYA